MKPSPIDVPTIDVPTTDGQAWHLCFDAAEGGWEWSHFDLVTARARQTIEAEHALPDFARAALTSTDESCRIVCEGEVVAGVLPGYARTGDAEANEVSQWHFAMTPHRLVTGRRHATRTLFNVWDAVRHGARPAGPAAVIQMAVAGFARDVRTRLATLDVVLDDIDEALSEPRDPDRLSNLGGRLGAVRREATRIRRALTPLARALHEDAEDLPEWTGLAEPGAAHRSLHTALDDLAALAERTRQLQDELTTRLTEETNRRLYFVSIVTTLFMPATFITGFFGMNTGGLPWGGDEAHHGTFFATLLCLGAVGAAIMLLRRKRLF